MARGSRHRHDTPGPAGFLVVDKPRGLTSHDVVDEARRWLGVRRVGHLGTLDPLATGVLPLAVREATRLIPFLDDQRKSYVGTIELGVATNTYDAEGDVVTRHDGPLPTESEVRAALDGFVGEILQVPPMFSSVKRDGVPLHRLARRGEEVEREPRKVRIDRITLASWAPPTVGIEVDCSAGTYVRAIAHDLGEELGCGAHLAGLCRTRSGPFQSADARSPEQWRALADRGEIEACLIRPEDALGLPLVRLTPVQARRVANGGDVPAAEARGEFESGTPPRPGDRLSAIAPTGNLLAVLELRPDRRMHPLRVLPGV